MGINFIGLAGGTAFNIVFDVLLQRRPPIGPRDQVFCACDTWMSCCRWVMKLLDYCSSFGCVFRDDQPSFLIPFASKLLESVGICPLVYCRHLLFVLRFFNRQTADEERIGKDRNVLIVARALVVVRSS